MIKLGCNDSIPNSWKWYKAQDCMDVRDGTHDSPKYVIEGYPLVTSKNLVSGQIDFSTCNLISKEDHDAISKRSAVDDGDILYAMIGTIGNPVIVEKSCDFSIKNVALFKFNNEKVFNRYIYHFLNSPLAERQFNSNSRGGTQKFVSLSNIRDLQIPLPPLAEQKRIAAILDKADSLRRKRQQAIQLADQFLRAVFLDMFGDPVTNPKGWEVKPLGEVAPSRPIRDIKLENSEDIWLLNLDQVESNSGRVLHKKMCKLSEVGSSTSWFDENHVLYSKLRPYLNKVVLPDGMGVATSELLPLKPNQNLLIREYLVSYLRSDSFVNWANVKVAGAKMPRLSISELWNHSISLPPIDLQKKYKKIFNQINQMRNRQEEALFHNSYCFNSLSQKAFAGELYGRMADES